MIILFLIKFEKNIQTKFITIRGTTHTIQTFKMNLLFPLVRKLLK